MQLKVGPVGQNIVDMAPGSVLLTSLQTLRPGGIHLPMTYIASIASGTQQTDSYNAYTSSTILSTVCPSLMPMSGFGGLFTNQQNPSRGIAILVVSLDSQEAETSGPWGDNVLGVIHAVNAAVFPTGPDVRQGILANINNIVTVVGVAPPFASTQHVLDLINTPISLFGRIAP